MVGEPPERCDLGAGLGADALLWSSAARALPQAIETCCPGRRQASCLLPTVAPHTASLPLCIPAPGRQLVTSLHPQHLASSRPPGKCSSPRCTPLEMPCSLQADPFSSEHGSPGLSVISRPAGDPVMTTPFLLDLPRWDLTLQGHFLLAPSLLMRSQLSAYSGLLYCPGQQRCRNRNIFSRILGPGLCPLPQCGAMPQEPRFRSEGVTYKAPASPQQTCLLRGPHLKLGEFEA